jgi:hypothetical protein
MGELVKMKILTKDGKASFDLKINPASLNLSKGITYSEDNKEGSSKNVQRYSSYAPETLSFDFVLDATGVAYEKKESIIETLAKFEKITYKYNGEEHKPNELKISWGNFIFDCFLESLSYNYTLFAPSGEPLRVKVSVSFSNASTRAEEVTEAQRSSPDLSHFITLKAGESIAFWCDKIYGDFSYCKEVAEFNGILHFRNVKPGTKLLFPKLLRHD